MKVLLYITLGVAVLNTASAEPSSKALKTCNGVQFDNTYLMCCNGAITPRPEAPCAKRENNKCCGQIGFNNKRFMCCYGNIHLRPNGKDENHKCCRNSDGQTEAFNNRLFMCCNGVVNDRPKGKRENHKCCQTVAFNNRKASCVNGVVVPNDKDEVFDDQVAVPLDD